MRVVCALAGEDLLDLTRHDVLEEHLQVGATQGFLLQELGRQLIEVVAVLAQDLVGQAVGGVEQVADLPVDLGGHLRGVVEAPATRTAGEGVALFDAVLDGAHCR